MRRVIFSIGAVALVSVALVAGVYVYGALNKSAPEVAGVQTAAGPCGLAQPVFCATFDSPSPVNSRAGQLDSTIWGASRIEGAIDLGSNLFNSASPSTMTGCGSSYTAQPGTTDIIICNGQLRESSYDEHGVSTLAVYAKQPFDWAGRTGTATFDLSNDTSGSHGTWPEFWITDQPVPAPFTHSEPTCDLCSVPRNGVGIDFSAGIAFNQAFGGDCANDGTRRWTVASFKIFTNYVEKNIALFASPDYHSFGCARQATGPNGPLNHVEVRISQSQIDVWATDPGGTVLHHLASATNANIPITRGVIWLEDSHYNAEKAVDASTQTPNLANHTFTWDNVGFDGPATYRDVSLDVMDALQPTNQNTDAPGVTGKLLNLGWGTTPTSPVNLNTVSGFTQAHIDAATLANKGALLMFNMGDANNGGAGITTINYTINGHAHTSAAMPFSTVGRSYHSIAIPLQYNEIVVGPQNIKLSANVGMMVTNVNVVLLAGVTLAGGSAGPTATPVVAGPTATTAPVATATPSSTVAQCRVQVSINGGPSQYKDQNPSFCGLP